MNSPQVLVVIPVFNARPYISKAIDSVLNQTYSFTEILVINDGSTDGSEKVIKPYLDKGVILWHQENQGPGAAMNRAMNFAHEHHIDFIARIDADDIALPERLEKQVGLMMKYPNSAACSANCYYIDPLSEEILGTSTVSKSKDLIRWEISNGLRGLIQGVTLFRTEALLSIGGYRNKFKFAEETDIFLRLAEKYDLHNSSDYLAKIRFYPGSFSLTNFHKNTLYQFYALNCAKKRRNNEPELEFDHFINEMTWETKLSIWHEETFLKLWRRYLVNHKSIYLMYASLFDLRRVFIRVLRTILN